jgi:hypothetical protein
MTKRLFVAIAAFLMIAGPAHAAIAAPHVDTVQLSRVTHAVTDAAPSRQLLTH